MCVIKPVEFRNSTGYTFRLNLRAVETDVATFITAHANLLKEYWDERGHKIYRVPQDCFRFDVDAFVQAWTTNKYIVCDIMSPDDSLVGMVGGAFGSMPLCTLTRLAIDIIYIQPKHRHPNIAEGTLDGLRSIATHIGADVVTVSAEAHVGKGLEKFWQASPLTTVYFVGTQNGND